MNYPQLPRIIGYEVLDELGRGGMGIVYRCLDKSGQLVAIKTLRHADTRILARFIREGNILRQLNHPYIVKMLDAFEQDGQHYLVMEYIEGGSLANLLKMEAPLKIRQILEIALGLADALTRAHGLKIIHRDLKPDNILIAADGTPRLTDFGVAHIDSVSTTEIGVVLGTLKYISPEALNSDPVDARADIWSFGIVLFEMLAGRLPFAGDQVPALVSSISTQPVPDLEKLRPDAPVALIDLIYRMLAKDPAERIPTVRLVGAQLETLLHDSNQPSRPIPDGPTDFGNETSHLSMPAKDAGTDLATFRNRFETPIKHSELPKHNLPAQSTPFVGREQELASLDRMLADPTLRLITIQAPGGMGKTRLALEAAAHQRGQFMHGCYFVALAPLSSPDLVVFAIANAVGFPFHNNGNPRQQLITYLHAKQMLLVLDNFEHLLVEAGIVNEILQSAPDVKVLATSREILNLQGEQVLALEGMAFPEEGSFKDALKSPVVELFMQSARRVEPAFELQPEQLATLHRIWFLSSGMPLGIELAAAWVEVLTPEEIAAEMQKSLDFLETEMRDVPKRQRSLRSVFDHSWQLLTDAEREIFKKVSVFRGGFTRHAVQQITGAGLRDLIKMINKSLLRREQYGGRYQVHEFLRQYAEEKLSPNESRQIYEAHARYFANFLSERWAQLKDYRQKAAVNEIALEVDNLRSAWQTMIENKMFAELRQSANSLFSVFVLWNPWHQEAADMFHAALQSLKALPAQADTEDVRALRGHLMGCLAWADCFLGVPERGIALAREALALLSPPAHPEASIMAYFAIEVGYLYTGQTVMLDEPAQAALDIARSYGDLWGTTLSLIFLGMKAVSQRSFSQAQALGEEAMAIAKREGAILQAESMAFVLAPAAEGLKQYEEAQRLFEEGLLLFLDARQNWYAQNCYRGLANLALDRQQYPQAITYFTQSLRLVLEMGRTSEILLILQNIAQTLALNGDTDRAVMLLALRQTHPARYDHFKGTDIASYPELVVAMGADQFHAAWRRGKALDLNTTIQQVLRDFAST